MNLSDCYSQFIQEIKINIMKRTAAGHKFLCLPLALFMLLCSFQVSAQTTITGTVTDAQGNAMPGVTVLEKGRSAASVTDDAGKYSISVSNSNGTLVFSYTGYSSEEVQLNGKSTIDGAMRTGVSKLDEVVVIGYGKQSREELTTSIAKLDEKTLENIPY